MEIINMKYLIFEIRTYIKKLNWNTKYHKILI